MNTAQTIIPVDPENNARLAALELARAGMPVFPCGLDKKPLTPHGFKDATTDAAEVDRLWRAHPGAMIGLPTGPASGLYVVDLDVDKDTGEAIGEASLARLGLSALLNATPGALTPSGGRHLYFADPGEGFGNTSNRIGPKVDTRGAGGYVIAPGSVALSGRYRPVGRLLGAALPPLPPELRKALGRPASAPQRPVPGFSVDLGRDSRADLSEVEDILSHIPPGCGYADWCAVLMGIHAHFGGSSDGLALAERWSAGSDKYKPGEVQAKWNGFRPGGGVTWGTVCALARQHGANLSDIAKRHRGADARPFAVVPGDFPNNEAAPSINATTPNPPPQRIAPTAFKLGDPSRIPPRQHLYGSHLYRRFLALTVAPGGLGKSSLVSVEALAMVTGRKLLDAAPVKPLRVWIWQGEDPRDELQRRISAACIHYGIGEADIGGRLHIDSGRDLPIKLVTQSNDGPQVATPLGEELIAAIRAEGIDVLIIDPLVTSHEATENDTGAMNAVASEWRRIADAADCAVELVHHTHKAAATAPGEFGIYGSRGSVSLIDAARSVRVLERMTEEEAAKAGVEDRWRYFRVSNGKANLAPLAQATWRSMVSVPLDNATEDYPEGDIVGVVSAWTPPDAFDGLTVNDLDAVQRAIADRPEPPAANERSATWAGYVVATALGLDAGEGLSKTQRTAAQNIARARVRSLLGGWLKSEALTVETVRDNRNGRDVQVIATGIPAHSMEGRK